MTEKTSNRDDEPLPQLFYCYTHSESCAVHQPPHDAVYVHCTCDEGTGRPRHKRHIPDPSLIRGSGTKH
jgi:hypothetical protein